MKTSGLYHLVRRTTECNCAESAISLIGASGADCNTGLLGDSPAAVAHAEAGRDPRIHLIHVGAFLVIPGRIAPPRQPHLPGEADGLRYARDDIQG